MLQIRISGVVDESVVDGPGIRMVIFTQGCVHNCPGCHNPQTHDPAGGEAAETDELIARCLRHKYIKGLTISGGEPFLQAEACAEVAKQVRESGRHVHVIVYSGYSWEELTKLGIKDVSVQKLLQNTDVLVDGRFISAQKNLDLPFRGSDNQRVIDVPASFLAGTPVILRWGRELAK